MHQFTNWFEWFIHFIDATSAVNNSLIQWSGLSEICIKESMVFWDYGIAYV